MFTVNPTVNNDPPTDIGKQVVGHLRTTFLVKKNIPSPPQYTDPVKLLQLLFGQHVHQPTIKKTLAFLLYIAENGDSLPLTFIVTINGMCGALTTSYWSTHFQKPSNLGPRWGVKYRRCSETLADVTAIICEKPVSSYAPSCDKGYFQCADSMCILSIHVCDDVKDCYDDSDESMCSNGQMWNITATNNIAMPSILTNSNSSLSDIYVPVHGICDGINSYTIMHHQEICVTKQPIYIDVTGMQNSKSFGTQTTSAWNFDTLWAAYQSEMRLNSEPQTVESLRPKPNETQTLNIENYLVPCTWKGEYIELEDRCKISVRKSVCD